MDKRVFGIAAVADGAAEAKYLVAGAETGHAGAYGFNNSGNVVAADLKRLGAAVVIIWVRGLVKRLVFGGFWGVNRMRGSWCLPGASSYLPARTLISMGFTDAALML